MKKVLFILSFVIASLFADAQTGTGTIDATQLVSVTGGDGAGTIATIVWSVQGTPPAPVVFSAPNKLKTDVTISAVGSYSLLLTVTDNLGNTATGIFPVKGITPQRIIIDTKNSKILSITISSTP